MIGLPLSAAAEKLIVNELSPEAIELSVGADGVLVAKSEVMTRLPVPVPDTATNFSCPAGPPQVIESQLLSAAEARIVHVMPSARTSAAVQERIVMAATAIRSAMNRPEEGVRDRTSNENALEILEFIF